MQTAPAAACAAATLAREASLADDFIAAGITPAILSPDRFSDRFNE